MDTRKAVVFTQALADDDGVFKVIAVKGDKGGQDVLAQGQFTINGGGTVGNDLAPLDAVTQFDTRGLI